jgi:hypothetical protein
MRVMLLLVFSLVIVSCKEANNKITFILLDECKVEVINKLEYFKQLDIYDFNYTIESFTLPINSQPTIKQYVSLFSSSESVDKLKAIANGPILACYPTASYELSMNDPDFLKKLELLYFRDASSSGKYRYSIISEDRVVIYSNRK